jgi:hypothetical protein
VFQQQGEKHHMSVIGAIRAVVALRRPVRAR